MGWFSDTKAKLRAESKSRAETAEWMRGQVPNDDPMTRSDKQHVANFRRGVTHLVYVANASYKTDEKVLKVRDWVQAMQHDLIRLASSGSYVEPMNEIIEAAVVENKDNKRAVSALTYLRR